MFIISFESRGKLGRVFKFSSFLKQNFEMLFELENGVLIPFFFRMKPRGSNYLVKNH